MSWLKVLVRRGLAAGVILITVGLGMWLLKIAHLAPPAQDNAIKLGSFVLTALGSVITLVNGTAKVLTPAPAPPVDEQLRLLATIVTSAVFDQRAHQVFDPSDTPAADRRRALADALAQLHQFATELDVPAPVLDLAVGHLDRRYVDRVDELVVAFYRELTPGPL